MFSSVLNEVSPEYSSKINMYKVDIEKETDIDSFHFHDFLIEELAEDE